jgi:hypothetical protein
LVRQKKFSSLKNRTSGNFFVFEQHASFERWQENRRNAFLFSVERELFERHASFENNSRRPNGTLRSNGGKKINERVSVFGRTRVPSK